MMTRSDSTPRCPARSCLGGFTLTELLVVVGIIALLLGMLTPSLYQAVRVTWRRQCSANLQAIVKACGVYAMADDRGRLPTVFTKDDANDPNNNPGHATWANINVTDEKQRGNPWGLWLLVQEKQVGRNAFLCPEAKRERGWRAPSPDAKGFSVDLQNGVSTLSYSYISMTRHRNWRERLAEKLTMDSIPGTLVIVADQNPRCVLGRASSSMAGRDEILNSLNHRRSGQNMVRLGGSVRWSADPNSSDRDGDNIYFSGVGSNADESMGRRFSEEDTFLIP